MSRPTFPHTIIALSFETKKRLAKFAKEKDETYDEILNRLMDFVEERGFERFHSKTK